MKSLLLRLEPIIWVLFGAGMMVGGLLLPAFILVWGIAGPLGWVDAQALSWESVHRIFSNPVGRLLLLAAIVLPLWGGAHHLRHVWIDFGGVKSDGLVGSALYAVALVGSLLGILAVADV